MSTPLSSILHDRSKNIDTRYHSIREFIIKKEVQLKFVKPQGQIVDIFTKSHYSKKLVSEFKL